MLLRNGYPEALAAVLAAARDDIDSARDVEVQAPARAASMILDVLPDVCEYSYAKRGAPQRLPGRSFWHGVA